MIVNQTKSYLIFFMVPPQVSGDIDCGLSKLFSKILQYNELIVNALNGDSLDLKFLISC